MNAFWWLSSHQREFMVSSEELGGLLTAGMSPSTHLLWVSALQRTLLGWQGVPWSGSGMTEPPRRLSPSDWRPESLWTQAFCSRAWKELVGEPPRSLDGELVLGRWPMSLGKNRRRRPEVGLRPTGWASRSCTTWKGTTWSGPCSPPTLASLWALRPAGLCSVCPTWPPLSFCRCLRHLFPVLGRDFPFSPQLVFSSFFLQEHAQRGVLSPPCKVCRPQFDYSLFRRRACFCQARSWPQRVSFELTGLLLWLYSLLQRDRELGDTRGCVGLIRPCMPAASTGLGTSWGLRQDLLSACASGNVGWAKTAFSSSEPTLRAWPRLPPAQSLLPVAHGLWGSGLDVLWVGGSPDHLGDAALLLSPQKGSDTDWGQSTLKLGSPANLVVGPGEGEMQGCAWQLE